MPNIWDPLYAVTDDEVGGEDEVDVGQLDIIFVDGRIIDGVDFVKL